METSVVKGLSRCLAETYSLYLTTQKCHWNVEGREFSSLHKMFEGQYEILAEYADVLAERIRGLGAYSPGSFSEFEELSNLPQLEEMKVLPEHMIKVLLKGYEILLGTLKKTMEVADKAKDVGTSDILLGQSEQHEKSMWMLRSTIKVARTHQRNIAGQRSIRPDNADSDKTRVANKLIGTARTKASVTPAVAMATVRQVSRATMRMNSALWTGGQKLAKKALVTFRLLGSHMTQGRNSVATPSGHNSNRTKLSQKNLERKSGSRNLPSDPRYLGEKVESDISLREGRGHCWP